MKPITSFAFTLAVSLAFSTLLSVSAATPFRKTNQPVAADWWTSYLDTHAYKQAPTPGVIVRSRPQYLAQHLEPFRQRLNYLSRLKQWVMTNTETKRSLTSEQRGILNKPFFPWDQQALQGEVMGRADLTKKLQQEVMLVEKVEGVLHDVATFLPDVKVRW